MSLISVKYHFYFLIFCFLVSLGINISCYIDGEWYACYDKFNIFNVLKTTIGLFLFGYLANYILNIFKEEREKEEERLEQLQSLVKKHKTK